VDEPVDLVESILDLTGWTQSRLVYELRRVARSLHEPEPTGLQPVTVNRWKRGRQKPGGYYLRLLRLLHTAIRGDLAEESESPRVGTALPPSDRNDDGDEMKRRRFFGYTAVLAGSLTLDPERLAAALLAGIGPDVRLVDDLSASITGHARRWPTDRPDALLPVVRSDMTTVNELRIGSQAAGVRRRLTSLTTATAALAGWLAWQAGNDEAANAYYTFAHSLASEVQDRDERAFVLALRSFVGSGLFGAEAADEGLALTMLHEAVELTERSASPFLRVFALSRRAEELARAGASDGAADRDLDRAQTILASTAAPHDGFFSYFSEERLLGCRGTCAMVQGRPRDVISLLPRVLSATPAELAAERSILVADLGAAHAMLGEVEQACALLGGSLELGGDGYANRVGRVRAIRASHLSRWSDAPPVARLDEELRTMAGALTGPSAAARQM
jgi:hypothetical protein